MKKLKAQWVITLLWLISFMFSAYVLFSKWQVIPNERGSLLKELSEVHSGPLTVMFLFLFFNSQTKTNQKKEVSLTLFILSVCLSVAYLAPFNYFLLLFKQSAIDARVFMETIGFIKPVFSFLITAEIAYFFGVKQ